MLCHAVPCCAMLCPSQFIGIDLAPMQHLHQDSAWCVQDDHGMQQEIQDLQQELHLSKDRLQEQNATIDLLQHEAEVCLLV